MILNENSIMNYKALTWGHMQLFGRLWGRATIAVAHQTMHMIPNQVEAMLTKLTDILGSYSSHYLRLPAWVHLSFSRYVP